MPAGRTELMLPARLATTLPGALPPRATTVRLPPTATTLLPVPTRMLVLKATETLDNALMLHGTEIVPRTPTSASAPLLTSLLRTTLATTDMPSLLLTPTHTVPSPLRPTVMPLSRTVPVATNSEEPLLPLPTRPDTRRTSTESGVASTAPRSDTESLAPRPMRLTPTVVVPLRTTVHALVPLASAPPVRLAADRLLPLPMAPTDGAMPVATTMAPLRATPTLATNPTPTLPPTLPTRASPTPLVATVMPLPASLATDHSVMPPPEASVTNGPAREVLRAPRATPRALPTRTLTPDPWMPLLATTPLLSPLPDSDRETRLPLPTVSDRLAVLDTPTPPLLAASVRVLPVDSEMAATVVSPDTVARRPTVPTTENTVTRPLVPLVPPAMASAVVASALPATPSAVADPLTTLASAVPVSDAPSRVLLPTTDALVPVPLDTTNTVLATSVAELPNPAAPLSDVTATLPTRPHTAALVPLVPVATLSATTTVHTTVPVAPSPRDTVALRATVATKATALPAATVDHLAAASSPVDTVALATVALQATVAVVATVAATAAATVATVDTEQMRMEVMDIEHYDQV